MPLECSVENPAVCPGFIFSTGPQVGQFCHPDLLLFDACKFGRRQKAGGLLSG
jgi:hypothetical protein